MSFPVLRALSLCTCCPQYPGAATGRRLRSSRPARNCSRVGLHIVLFEACSAFTRVAARTLAPSPICHQLPRRLQPFRHLHDCSGCFRLERSPGGTCTHWKAPPSHGARKKRSFLEGLGMARFDPHGRLPSVGQEASAQPFGARWTASSPAREPEDRHRPTPTKVSVVASQEKKPPDFERLCSNRC